MGGKQHCNIPHYVCNAILYIHIHKVLHGILYLKAHSNQLKKKKDTRFGSVIYARMARVGVHLRMEILEPVFRRCPCKAVIM
jgi:hypothetical protein